MKRTLKKWSLALTSLLCLLSAPLRSDYFDEYHACTDQTSVYDSLCDGFFGKFRFSADLLVWNAHQGGIDTLISDFVTDVPLSVSVDGNFAQIQNSRRTSSRYHSDWRVGYRFGLGYEFGCEGWNVLANWTHMPGKAKGHLHQNPDLRAKGSWDLTYDTVDLVLASPQYCSCTGFNWGVFTGLRAARINQKIRARQDAITTTAASITGPSTGISRAWALFKNNYRGVGPEVGMGASWDFCRGISVFGKIDGAILYSRYRRNDYVAGRNTLTTAFLGGSLTQVSINTDRSKSSGRFYQIVADFALGANWVQTVDFFECDSELALRFAWEHSQWYSHIASGIPASDLALDGFTLSATLSY